MDHFATLNSDLGPWIYQPAPKLNRIRDSRSNFNILQLNLKTKSPTPQALSPVIQGSVMAALWVHKL